MVAEIARVRFFVAKLKSGDSSYPNLFAKVTWAQSVS
jgi:hypothetical protein